MKIEIAIPAAVLIGIGVGVTTSWYVEKIYRNQLSQDYLCVYNQKLTTEPMESK